MRFGRVSLICTLACFAGCGQAKFVPVQGQITIDGQPGKNLFVQFEPLAGDKSLYPGPGSIGRTDEQGAFRLVSVPDKHEGAVVAKHMVKIYVEGGGLNDDELALRGESIKNRRDRPKQLPAKFNERSELTFDVPPGGAANADFALTTK